MKKVNKKFLITFVLIISALFVFQTRESLADDKYINGKVVYSDNLTPVNGSVIDVLLYSEPNKTEVIIESTTSNSNGEFRILVPSQTSDRIKIMAYPNEDNTQNMFERKVINYDGTELSRSDKYQFIIEVKRATNNHFGKTDLD